MVNQVWAIDFAHDPCANGQKLKSLTVAEDFTREGLAIEVAGAIRSMHVIDVLSRLVSERGVPMFIRSDNVPEFVSRAILKRITDEGIAMALIDPGMPWPTGVNESFNGKFRDECLNMEWFRSRAEARVVIVSWLEHFNTVRPHWSLCYLTPRVVAEKCRNEPSSSQPSTGRHAAVPGVCAPRPVAQPLRKGQNDINERVGFSS